MYSRWMPPECSTELYHHGIRDMKWGERHGPPYPLSQKAHNAVVKGESPKTRNTGGSVVYSGQRPKEYKSQSATVYGSQKKEKNQYDHSESAIRKVSKWSLLGANIALDLMTLNPIGLGYDVIDVGSAIAGSVKEMRFDARTKNLATDPKTGLKVKDSSKQWTPEEDMKAINPGYISTMSSGTKNNCVLCSLSYDLRRRGYDVAAGNAVRGYNFEDLKHWYPGVTGTATMRYENKAPLIEPKENRQKYIANSIDAIKKTGEGARGTLFVTWKGSFSGHALAYEVRNGEVHIYDCQNGKKQDPEKLLKQTSDSTAYRLDNLQPDPKYIKEVTRRK